MRSVFVCLMSVALVVSCRQRWHWAGARLIDNGAHLELAAKASLCGCITLMNKTNDSVILESTLEGAVTGRGTLPPHGRLRQRFDWAGESHGANYIIKAFDGHGHAIDFESAVETEHTSSTDCADVSCDIEPLKMSVGTSGRAPGER